MTTMIKFDGKEVNVQEAGVDKQANYSAFVAQMASNFMSSDVSMQEAFTNTKLEFAAKQAGTDLPKFAFAQASGDQRAQQVGGVADSGVQLG